MITDAEHREEVMKDLKRIVRDSEELLQDSAGAVGAKAHELRQRLTHTLESAKATCSRLQERTQQKAKAADKVIRDYPYQSIGVAFGIGLLIGLLVTRKQ